MPTHHDHSGHDHHHADSPARLLVGPRREGEARRLAFALGLSLATTAVEAIGGWLSNSLALGADAGHMLADTGAIALSLFAIGISSRPADAKRTYGYYRLEILAALANGAVLIALAAGIAIEAWGRLQRPQEVHLGTVAALAGLGMALNGAGLWVTHAGAHGSMNLRSTFLHLAGDLLNSLGVLVAAGLIWLTGKTIFDPLVSFLIAGTIVFGAFRLCREAVDVLLEGVPPHLNLEDVNRELASVAGVSAVHDLHVWTITSGLVALSCHIVVACDGPDCRSHDDILVEAKGLLRERFRIDHTTIQFESESYQHDEAVH